MSEILHPQYLPFTQERLRDHFAPAGTEATSADAHLAYYVKSAQAAKDWAELPLSGPPGEVATARKHSLQIQKDERFWVVTALMSIFHAPGRVPVLAEMLRRCLGEVPPIEGLATWEQALGDPQQLNLYFEVSLPTPKGYRKYLVDRLPQRVLVQHVLESATRTATAGRALEGATKVDAVLIAPKTGFAVLFEAKVLADAACSVGFDVLRNQIARNIDVMLEPNPNLRPPLTQRRPDRTCFVLITPEIFRDHPEKPTVWLADARLPKQPGCIGAGPAPPCWNRLQSGCTPTGMAHLGRLQPAASRRLPMAPRHRQLSAAFARAPAGAEILRRCENRQRSFRRGQRCHPASTPGRHQIGGSVAGAKCTLPAHMVNELYA